MKIWLSNHPVFIIIILCLLSRLPQLLSSDLVLDGDETIVGLMAKHFSEGKGIPYFFYGQSYGFSFIEVICISLFYLFFGVTGIAIKLAMLSLWTVGIVFFYKAIQHINPEDKWNVFLITLVFIFAPSWMIWSMKARGGYLTSFTLFSIILYLMFNNRFNKHKSVSLLIGLLTVVIYQSQPLWLAGLTPIFIYHFYKLKIKHSILFLCGILSAAIGFYFLKLNLSHFWSPQVISLSNFNLKSLGTFPVDIYNHLTGSYDYEDIIPTTLSIKLWSCIFTLLIFTVLGIGIIYLSRKKKINPLFYVLCLSELCSIGYLFLLTNVSPRYLLPLTGYSLLLLFSLATFERRYITKIVFCFLIILGCFSITDFKFDKYESTHKSDLFSLINKLESRKIYHIYCEGGLLQWQIMFYSQEKIIARYFSNTDRYPKYIERVDDALTKDSTKIAIIGYFPPKNKKDSLYFIGVDERYCIYENPGKQMLIKHGFDLSRVP